MDEDGVRERAWGVTTSDLLDAGVGVGIPLSASNDDGWLSRLAREGGRLRVLRSLCSLAGAEATESRSLWRELA